MKKTLYLLSFFCVSVFSKPLLTTEYRYYDIFPTNKHKLEDSMDENSPLLRLGSIRHGNLNWKIKYLYKKERKKGICSITAVKTEVKVIYTVPKLAKNYKAPKGTRKVFNRYYSILKNYLDKNKKYAVNAAKEIERELIKIKPVINDCELLSSNAKKTARKILQKYKKQYKDFEILTYEGFLDKVKEEKL